MKHITSTTSVVKNLQDAGCDVEIIEQFIHLEEKGKISEQIGLLEEYRKNLLNTIHSLQKKLDCLDFLRYQIRMRKK